MPGQLRYHAATLVCGHKQVLFRRDLPLVGRKVRCIRCRRDRAVTEEGREVPRP